MADNIGFHSDRGDYMFGAWAEIDDDPYIYERVLQSPKPNNLLSFFGLPYIPKFSGRVPPESEWTTATITNGAKIRAVNVITGGDYYFYIDYINNKGTIVFSTYSAYRVHSSYYGTTNNYPIGIFTGFYNKNHVFAPLGMVNSDADKNPIEGRIEPIPGDLLRDPTSSDVWTPEQMNEFFNGSYIPAPPPFPGPDNEKDPSGGDGEGPDAIPDDPIEVPEEPPITASKSGLLTIYTPSASQLHDFGAFLWSDLFSLDTFKKLFADPMEAVIGLSVLPIAIPHTAGAESINIGQIDSNVFAFLATKQFVRHDCGEIKIDPVWNTALDYSPYTKFSIFLPYIGTREIKADDVMGKTVGVTYMVDILSGSCTAHIKVNGTVLYQFSGSCAVPIPVTGSSWNNLLTSSIQLAGTGIAAAVTAGASTTVSAAASGLAIAGTAGLVANSKQGILRTGAVSGAAGMLGVQTPYIIRETMRQSLAKDYAHYYGYPSNITSLLGDLSGYTVVQACHLKNIDATGDELDEIERLLKDGVLL